MRQKEIHIYYMVICVDYSLYFYNPNNYCRDNDLGIRDTYSHIRKYTKKMERGRLFIVNIYLILVKIHLQI